MPLYDAVADLPLEVDSYELEHREFVVSTEFTRVTTLVHLRGAGEEGIGEDVTYTAGDHPPPADLPLAGSHRLDTFSQLFERLALFRSEPQMEASRDYRRWAFESAALDLALRQAGKSLAEAVGREPSPVTFVSSKRLADPQSADQIRSWLDLYPGLRFKLDPTVDWDEQLIADLAATGAVDSLDLKGAYKGTPVDLPPDPELYRRVVEGFPGAWIEDPAVTDETRPILEPHARRITWDAPIHSVENIENVPWPPRWLRQRAPPLRRLRLLRGARHRSLRGRAVGAGARSRADPVPRLALPSGYPERRCPGRLQRPRAAARSSREPTRACAQHYRLPVGGLTYARR